MNPSSAGLRLVLTAALLAGALAACGKRSPPSAPEGEEAIYTYPRVYPAPATVLPGPETSGTTGEVPPHAGDISPLPQDRTKRTYQSYPAQ